MEDRIRVRFESRLSLVLHMIDAYTGGIPIDIKKMDISLTGVRQQPIRKANGYIVFTDLLTKTYEVNIKSRFYADQQITIDVGTLHNRHSIVQVPLLPSPSYPVENGVTVVRANLIDQSGMPIVNGQAKGVPQDKNCAKGRIAQRKVAKGETMMKVAPNGGRMFPGDYILFKGDNKEEYHQVLSVDQRSRMIEIANPLAHDYERGDLLFPVVYARSDARGEIALYFRNYRLKEFNVFIEFSHQHLSSFKEVGLIEGEPTMLGTVELS